MLAKCIFVFALVAVGGPWSRADVALVAGIVVALSGLGAWRKESAVAAKWLIQACVVALGLRLDLGILAQSALDGLLLAVGTIVGAVVLGLLLGRLLRTGRELSTLVTSGTAICGGSAIVAIGSSIGASSSNMAVATGAIFILNAIGLWTIPFIGHSVGLSDLQFGQWAGIALHDISSVGGAAKGYHAIGAPVTAIAFDTATVVKLTRVIWITPMAILAGRYLRSGNTVGAPAAFPWFIVFFILASAVRTFVPGLRAIEGDIAFASGIGFQVALFLIGTALSREALKQVGWRAIAQATALWVLLAGSSLVVIKFVMQ